LTEVDGWHRVDPADVAAAAVFEVLSRHLPADAVVTVDVGATGLYVTHRDQLETAMTRLFSTDGPATLHIEQDPELL
jgi:thiamine pyrophosphate-dependent acetolactate synthase large subunit-like protein